MKTAITARPHSAACAGQECPERHTCLRFMRPVWHPHKDRVTGAVTVQLWASFDIERRHFGDCPNKQEATKMQRELMKVAA